MSYSGNSRGVCAMQQAGIGAATMVMPPTAMYTADATASFNGMMTAAGHLPTVQTGNTGIMMMTADDDGCAAWNSANADVSNYLSAKTPHMVHTNSCYRSFVFTCLLLLTLIRRIWKTFNAVFSSHIIYVLI